MLSRRCDLSANPNIATWLLGYDYGGAPTAFTGDPLLHMDAPIGLKGARYKASEALPSVSKAPLSRHAAPPPKKILNPPLPAVAYAVSTCPDVFK